MTSNNSIISSSTLDVSRTADDAMSVVNNPALVNDVNDENLPADIAIHIPAIWGFHVVNLLRLLVFIEFLALLILWLTSGRCLCLCSVNQLSISYEF